MVIDIRATDEGRTISPALVEHISAFIRVPLTVGGGVTSINEFASLLEAGADKILIGSGQFTNPSLVSDLAKEFGSQAIVCSVDASRQDGGRITSHSGRVNHALSAVDWAIRLESEGAGELLVQCVERDGTMEGMALDLLAAVSSRTSIPVIGSSGAGKAQDFVSAASAGCSAVAAGAVFQFTETTPREAKEALLSAGLPTRIS